LTWWVGRMKELETPRPTTMAATRGSTPMWSAMETPRGMSSVQARKLLDVPDDDTVASKTGLSAEEVAGLRESGTAPSGK